MYISDCPDLLKEWDYELNIGVMPHEITAGNSRKLIHWICSKCGNKWPARAYNRSHLKQGCPECGKKSISRTMKQRKFRKGINDMASQRPDLLLEWDYESNVSLSPYEITVGHSRPAVKWVCSKCNHRWSATVANRVGHNSGCPKCSKEVIAAKARERRFDSAKSLCSME